MPRSANKFKYRYHVTGTLNGISIDRKYCSYTEFLNEYGGTATPLKLNRQKLTRLNTGFYKDKQGRKSNKMLASLWQLEFKAIDEPRAFTIKTTKTLTPEPTPPTTPQPIDSEPEDEPAPAPAPAPSSDELDAYEGVTFQVFA